MDRSGKARGHTPDAHVSGKSDISVVPRIVPNNAQAAEAREVRKMTKRNSEGTPATEIQGSEATWSGLNRIREAAARDRHLRFTNLLSHITEDLLHASYKALREEAAPGVDGVTWNRYGEDLQTRIRDLKDRIHSGRYRARPSKRIWIPKPDGRERPIGIASLEDKVVQEAVKRILNQIYEVDFKGYSYGFRPGRSQHNALDALYVAITQRKVSWVLDADIRSFFDTIRHEWLIEFLEHRIADPRMLRLIRKWLRAGVSEEGEWSKTKVGTPQGSVISPLLANIYLHYVLDLWVDQWRKSQPVGEVYIVRYCDDFVMGFQYQRTGERFLRDLEERFAQFGLELHREKTRLIEFGRFALINRIKRGAGKPETFDFLGFTHICAKRRQDGGFALRRKTKAKRLRSKAKEVRKDLMEKRHEPVPDQGKWLRSVVQGYFNYHAVPGNKAALNAFRTLVCKAWLHALRRRSQKSRNLTWLRMKNLIQTWIPPARISHPYPNQRLRVSYSR